MLLVQWGENISNIIFLNPSYNCSGILTIFNCSLKNPRNLFICHPGMDFLDFCTMLTIVIVVIFLVVINDGKP